MYLWFMVYAMRSPITAVIQFHLFSSVRNACELLYRIRYSNSSCHGGSATPLGHVGHCLWFLLVLLSSCGNKSVLSKPLSLRGTVICAHHAEHSLNGRFH
jgi:hypothetical protein